MPKKYVRGPVNGKIKKNQESDNTADISTEREDHADEETRREMKAKKIESSSSKRTASEIPMEVFDTTNIDTGSASKESLSFESSGANSAKSQTNLPVSKITTEAKSFLSQLETERNEQVDRKKTKLTNSRSEGEKEALEHKVKSKKNEIGDVLKKNAGGKLDPTNKVESKAGYKKAGKLNTNQVHSNIQLEIGNVPQDPLSDIRNTTLPDASSQENGGPPITNEFKSHNKGEHSEAIIPITGREDIGDNDHGDQTNLLKGNLSVEDNMGQADGTRTDVRRQESDDYIDRTIRQGEIVTVPFNSTSPIFIEIHRANIFHYFSSAIIAPSKYFNNRPFSDLQAIDINYLVLANSPSLSDSSETILLNLSLGKGDVDRLHINGEIALMDFPIPITQVGYIIVKNNEVRESILNDASLHNGGYIPQSIIKTGFPESKLQIKLTENSFPKITASYFDLVSKFNRTLGLFAFIRNYSQLTSLKTGSYKSLPDHFFIAMQAIEENFGSNIVPKGHLIEFYSFLFEDNCPGDKKLLQWLFRRIQKNENFNDDDVEAFEQLYNSVKDQSIPVQKSNEIFNSLKSGLNRKNALEKVDGLKSKSALPLYIFAYLRNYGNLNSIEISRRDLSTLASNSFGEYAFAILGYFYGYAALKNSDERQSNLSKAVALSKEVSNKPAIKFKLESEFDHAIIDMVFNKVFNKGTGHFLKSTGNKIEGTSTSQEEETIIIERYTISDTVYERIKILPTVSVQDNPMTVISRLPENIPYHSEFGFLCQRLSMIPQCNLSQSSNVHIMNMSEILKYSTFSKKEMIERLKKSRVTEEELVHRIFLSKSYKEV